MIGRIIEKSFSLGAILSAENGDLYVVKILEGDADVGDQLRWPNEPRGVVQNTTKAANVRLSLELHDPRSV